MAIVLSSAAISLRGNLAECGVEFSSPKAAWAAATAAATAAAPEQPEIIETTSAQMLT